MIRIGLDETKANISTLVSKIPFPNPLPKLYVVRADVTKVMIHDYVIYTHGDEIVTWSPSVNSFSIKDKLLSQAVNAICNSNEVTHGNVLMESEQLFRSRGMNVLFKGAVIKVELPRLLIMTDGQGAYRINLDTGNISRPNGDNGYNSIKGMPIKPNDTRLELIRENLRYAKLLHDDTPGSSQFKAIDILNNIKKTGVDKIEYFDMTVIFSETDDGELAVGAYVDGQYPNVRSFPTQTGIDGISVQILGCGQFMSDSNINRNTIVYDLRNLAGKALCK